MILIKKSAGQVYNHPLFWAAVKKLEFLARFGDGMSSWRNTSMLRIFNFFVLEDNSEIFLDFRTPITYTFKTSII